MLANDRFTRSLGRKPSPRRQCFVQNRAEASALSFILPGSPQLPTSPIHDPYPVGATANRARVEPGGRTMTRFASDLCRDQHRWTRFAGSVGAVGNGIGFRDGK